MVTNIDDTKCAPSKEYKDGSCFSTKSLQKIINNYNKKFKQNININLPKKELVNKITKIFNNKCDDQACWLRQELVINIDEDNEIRRNTLRPEGPDGKYEWLSTLDINNIMEQYHSIHKNFIFLGALPYDFEDIGVLEMNTNELFKDMIDKGKTRFGIVINLDSHNMSGSHWVGLYTDFDKNQVYFFDSVGKKPRKKIKKFINNIVTFMYNKNYPNKKLNINNVLKSLNNNHNNVLKSLNNNHNNLSAEQINNLKKFNIKYNKVQQQYKDSECGVYSVNFIIRLLEGESFDNICNNITYDDKMNKNRKIYFRNA
jgi:hypothetical protein